MSETKMSPFGACLTILAATSGISDLVTSKWKLRVALTLLFPK